MQFFDHYHAKKIDLALSVRLTHIQMCCMFWYYIEKAASSTELIGVD